MKLSIYWYHFLMHSSYISIIEEQQLWLRVPRHEKRVNQPWNRQLIKLNVYNYRTKPTIVYSLCSDKVMTAIKNRPVFCMRQRTVTKPNIHFLIKLIQSLFIAAQLYFYEEEVLLWQPGFTAIGLQPSVDEWLERNCLCIHGFPVLIRNIRRTSWISWFSANIIAFIMRFLPKVTMVNWSLLVGVSLQPPDRLHLSDRYRWQDVIVYRAVHRDHVKTAFLAQPHAGS